MTHVNHRVTENTENAQTLRASSVHFVFLWLTP